MNVAMPPKSSAIVEDDKTTTHLWWRWFLSLSKLVEAGFTGTIALAKVTPGGADGSMVFKNGVLIKSNPPT